MQKRVGRVRVFWVRVNMRRKYERTKKHLPESDRRGGRGRATVVGKYAIRGWVSVCLCVCVFALAEGVRMLRCG